MLPPLRHLLARVYLLPAVVALLLLLLGGVGYLVVAGKREPVHAVPEVPGVWATDIQHSGPGAARLGAKVPGKPFEGQRKPPCEPRLQKQVNGGCWVVLKAEPAPHCPEGSFEHRGECLLPVLAAQDVPVSGQRAPME